MGLEKYCIYIRKSRKDMEAEERGEGRYPRAARGRFDGFSP